MWRLPSRLVSRLPRLVPPLEFPCRIDRLPEGCAELDNDLYRDPATATSSHADDRTRQLATLQLLNSARIPYFDRVWTQQLRLSPERAGSFLEVGCGGGVASCALAALGYNMTGVDPAEASLDAARAHARRLGLSHSTLFATGSAYDLSSFPADSFDGVLMADVLEHLYDLPAAVDQVWRVLRPGGVLVFDTVNRTYASYLLAIVVAQELAGAVPPRTHDWRMFVKPHELSFLLQSRGFLVDSSQFRGMAPTLAPSPAALVAQLRKLRTLDFEFPGLPLSDYVEVPSLEVQYLGWAAKGNSRAAAPDDLARGLRAFERS
ncbi:hypothetical protein AB1Y20_007325 [Prymnesium parvum]|uniref:Methyltransferase type 11 domain-containing protein n=1 Tax=Prymnesium parvum TaxID=97485 RepID=A0AB34IUM5_PRYPA